jgi:ribose/xylose/arabinose/galactoside ABC-type transport system permease subunit
VISTKSEVGVASITSNTYSWIGNGSVGPVPAPTIIAGAFAIAAWFLLSYTSFGVSCRAVGGNVTSARRSGLHVGRVIVAAYIISAVASGVAAIILTSILTTSTVTLGQGYELTAITAVVMGGVSMFGGVGDIPGALLGVLFLSFLANGFSFLNYAPQVNEIVTGAILVLAVALDQGVRRTLRRRRAWAQTDLVPKRQGNVPGATRSVPVP